MTQINPTYIPIGKDYKVNAKLTITPVPMGVPCRICALFDLVDDCADRYPCEAVTRRDGENVYFVAVPSEQSEQPKQVEELTSAKIQDLALEAGIETNLVVELSAELISFARLIQKRLEK